MGKCVGCGVGDGVRCIQVNKVKQVERKERWATSSSVKRGLVVVGIVEQSVTERGVTDVCDTV